MSFSGSDVTGTSLNGDVEVSSATNGITFFLGYEATSFSNSTEIFLKLLPASPVTTASNVLSQCRVSFPYTNKYIRRYPETATQPEQKNFTHSNLNMPCTYNPI